MVYYNDNELIIRNMEVLSEYMSNEVISRMGRVSGIRINLVRNTKRKLQMMIISCFSYLRN